MKQCMSIIFFIFILSNALFCDDPLRMYVVTASDSKYFKYLPNFIGSLFYVNFNELRELAIFDLGLTQEQKKYLKNIPKVTVYDVKKVHPDILKQVRVNNYGKMVPGWYAWKPVIIKQALDMFPYIFYVDAGTTFLKPLNDLFKHIIEHGYFFVDCGHDIKIRATKYVIKKFDLESPKNKWILNKETYGLAGGIQGLSRAVYQSYVIPMYELAKDLRNFIDDGTTHYGFGAARHDQTLFGIMACLNNMAIQRQDNGDGAMTELVVRGKKIPVHITWDPKLVNQQTLFWSSRDHMPRIEFFKQCIQNKQKKQMLKKI